MNGIREETEHCVGLETKRVLGVRQIKHYV